MKENLSNFLDGVRTNINGGYEYKGPVGGFGRIIIFRKRSALYRIYGGLR